MNFHSIKDVVAKLGALSTVFMMVLGIGYIAFENSNVVEVDAAFDSAASWAWACPTNNNNFNYEDNVAYYNNHLYVLNNGWDSIVKIDTSCNVVSTTPLASNGFFWAITANDTGVYALYDRSGQGTENFGNGVTHDYITDFAQFGILKVDDNSVPQWFSAPSYSDFIPGTATDWDIIINGSLPQISNVGNDICITADTSAGINDGGFQNYDPTVLYCVNSSGGVVLEQYLTGNNLGQDKYIHEPAKDSSGNYYFMATIRGNNTFTIGGTTTNVVSSQGSDVWLLSLDSSGNFRWATMISSYSCTDDIQTFGDGGLGLVNGELVLTNNIITTAGVGNCFYNGTYPNEAALNTEANAANTSYGLVSFFNPSTGALNSSTRFDQVGGGSDNTAILDSVVGNSECLYVIGRMTPALGVQYLADTDIVISSDSASRFFATICAGNLDSLVPVEGTGSNSYQYLTNLNDYIVLGGRYANGSSLNFGVASYSVSSSSLTYAAGFLDQAPIVPITCTTNTGNGDQVVDVCLDVVAGALTIYAGDNTDNDDVCTKDNITNGDSVEVNASNVATSLLSCVDAEAQGVLNSLSVTSSRQNTQTVIEDIVFEDLRGVATSSYSITATLSDLNGSTSQIDLGTNPDGAQADTDADAPQGADNGKIFAVIDPSGGTIAPLRPGSAISTGTANFSLGSSATIIDEATTATLFFTTSDVTAGRYELDGTSIKYRIPAFPEQDNYTTVMTVTIV